MQGYKCVSYGIIMYSFQNNKVCGLNSSVFFSSLCLFRRNNYTFRVASLGHLWNILYEKEPLQLCFTELGKKAVVFLCQNVIMRCHVTILAEIYGDPIFSDPVRVLSIGRNLIRVLLIRSDPVRSGPIRSDPVLVLLIRSDPIRSRFCKRPNTNADCMLLSGMLAVTTFEITWEWNGVDYR